MTLIEDIQKNLEDKGLSESSIKLYINNLVKLNEGIIPKNFKFLEDIENIKSKLSPLKETTRKSYLTCIVSVLNTFSDNKKLKALCNKYYEIMKDAVKTLKETPKSEMSETQKENWLDWTKILDIYKTQHEQIMKYINNKELSPIQYNKLLNFMVLSLYVLTPPRRNQDYAIMNIVKVEQQAKDKNYLILDKKQFEFNVFKTAKDEKDEITTFDIPAELQHNIGMYIKHHPLLKGKKITNKTNVSFLVDIKGKPLTSTNSITRILNKVFDKKIGVSMLRHSYLTHKYGNDTKEREKDANMMGHNTMTQNDYIKDK
jgi:integrase